MRHTPLYNNVIVVEREPESRTPGGIIIPQVAHDARIFGVGEVIAVGDGHMNPSTGRLIPMRVKEGDVVMFSRSACARIPWTGYPDGSVGVVAENNIITIITDLERDTGLRDADGRPLTVPADANAPIAVIDADG